ncbi:transmembrane protein 255B isoform X6 [Esox lucius]|uniref:transmembrane protein 255B isoform X6 n=1 Tax=Esox lucius TaxID=8010 RepID=UPI0005778A92|nr:transmembrane protein 255B isoform X6 [Esox lucius]
MTARTIQDARGRDKPALSQAELMTRRKRSAIWVVLGMLCLSMVLVILGVYTTTRTESINITGYASGIILVAAIVFLSFGIITSFLCLMVDGVFIVFNMDIRPLKAGRCQFYTSGSSYIYENYYASVPCQGLLESCSMKVRSGTCYCCDLYDCANGGYMNNYYEFVGVQSCGDVLSLYALIWLLTSLNLMAFFLGILTTAVLGSIKDQRASLYLAPVAGPGVPQSDPSVACPEPNPPPFAPLYNLLPYKPQSFSV